MTLSLTSLSLHQFRNYESERLQVSTAPVVLSGPNGAGKTNVLEAISLLSPGKGLRRAALSDIPNRAAPEPAWAVAASVSGMQGEASIGTGRDPESSTNDKRITRIDGKDRPQSELAKHMAILWLTPQMEQLFNEGNSAGRKFLDRLVYSFDADHASRVNEYEFAMRERNKLLADGKGDATWLEALEQTMAETGVAIGAARLDTIEHLNHSIAGSGLSFPKAAIDIQGLAENQLKAGKTAISVEDFFKNALAAGRGPDAAAGRALHGSHRSEMRVAHAGKGLPAEACSTGEQKALLLSIVLSQARVSGVRKRVVPLLLLDEVAGHLDATRRLELFEEICQIGAQVWMTGTDPSLFAGMEGTAQYFRVENGSISTYL